MVPPRGNNNIIAASYEYTQGLAGNVALGQLTVLRPGYSAIATVVNPAPAQGGVDGDSVDDLATAAPPQVKANDRAVQLGDLDTLSCTASSAVCRAHAVLMPDQRIAVGVLALSTAARPYAPPALLDEVTSYLRARCLAPLAQRIYCREPDYLPIDVVAQVSVNVPADQRNAVQLDLATQLQAFLQPVFGGPDGQGWDFGQTVQAAQVSRFLRKDPRVVGVSALSLNGQQGVDIALSANQVPTGGRVSVLAYTTVATR
jgi:predicted phage baseplate assembly protein